MAEPVMANSRYGRPEDMTEQGVFDKVAAHMMLQGQKCIDGSGTCSYRDECGEMACAAGCLLTNEEAYLFGSRPWREIVPEDFMFCSSLVGGLQCIHDDTPVSAWYRNLKRFAEYNKLDTTVLDTCERGGELKEKEKRLK